MPGRISIGPFSYGAPGSASSTDRWTRLVIAGNDATLDLRRLGSNEEGLCEVACGVGGSESAAAGTASVVAAAGGAAGTTDSSEPSETGVWRLNERFLRFRPKRLGPAGEDAVTLIAGGLGCGATTAEESPSDAEFGELNGEGPVIADNGESSVA